ncbi:unnamed protein product [Ilex paraguariensis]|uniref:Uncharacterized protein n=1 Tax=Ilex paraguariensis TaxID=185542 RepID=A0ABC8RPL5_9AQUA
MLDFTKPSFEREIWSLELKFDDEMGYLELIMSPLVSHYGFYFWIMLKDSNLSSSCVICIQDFHAICYDLTNSMLIISTYPSLLFLEIISIHIITGWLFV